jgi:putative ABC transport system substrate-binding protein
MRRREFVAAIGGAAVIWPVGITRVFAKRPLIGVLAAVSRQEAERFLTGFPQGLRELGYVEGRDYEIEYRYADGDVTRMPSLAEELIRLKPEVIVTGSSQAAVVLSRATATIPIVSASITDPVSFGLVETHAHPGGNVTGILNTLDTLPGKQLELAHELVPTATRIGMLVNVHSQTYAVVRRSAETAAKVLGITLVPKRSACPTTSILPSRRLRVSACRS